MASASGNRTAGAWSAGADQGGRPFASRSHRSLYRRVKTRYRSHQDSMLRTIKTFDIAEMKCSEITSADIVSFAQSLKVAPQTVSNYLSHLAAIFAMARPAWGYPLEQQVIKDAFVLAKKPGITAKGRQRERRPTLAELDRILEHFGLVKARRSDAIPMQRIIPFAIFSTRRQEEIVRIRWQDFRRQPRYGAGYEASRR